jgi:two-component system, NarL family, sensor histidine kinase DesK
MGFVRPADHELDERGNDVAWTRAAYLVRQAELAVLAFTAVLALVELGRIAVLYSARYVVIAGVATAVWLPLHVWHLRYGLRGERPPRSGATLAVIAVVQFAALALIGPAWSFMLATLATSSLIVLRSPWSLLMLAVCVVAPVPAALLHPEYTLSYGSNDAYLMVSVAFRSCLQFTLVWLVACARELVASRAVLAREAAQREHARLETSMRAMLEQNLVRLAAEARRARAEVLEPGVSAALVALDRVLDVATTATGELRRVVSEARMAPGVDPAGELARAEARARTPVGRGLTVRGAWRYFVAANLVVLGFVLFAGLGAFGSAHAGPVVIPAWAALTLVHVSSLLAVARGLRPRWAYGRFVLVVVIDVAMMFVLGDGWREPGWYIGVAAAVAFRGRARVAAVAAVFVLAGAYDVWRTVQAAPSTGLDELSWGFVYTAALTALGVIGLYGSARLITLLGQLDCAREAQVSFAVDAERRRIWSDVHDVLGQTLTAITLKADLARRMVADEPTRSLAELDEVIELATDQAHELGVIARGERDVIFEAEIENAISLLRAAGIEVSTKIEVDELGETTSELLGWSIREGTTNILRHARAGRVWIRAARESGRVTLELRNDGVVGQMAAGTGLRGLAERAAAEDGRAAGRVLPGGQFVLAVSLPERVAV